MGGGGSKPVEVVRYVPAPAPVVTTTTTTTTTTTVVQKISKAFEKVTVDKKKLNLAVTALKRAKATGFDYSLANDKFEGVKKENVTKFCDIVCKKLHLVEGRHKDAVTGAFAALELADKSKAKIEELRLDVTEFRSLYGFIFAAVNDDGKFDVAYTIYQLEFKLNVSEGFSMDEMKAIKMHYSKNEALLTLKQENVIANINYINC